MDYLSQPSRAVLAFLNINNIPHEVKQVQVAAMEHRSPEFL